MKTIEVPFNRLLDLQKAEGNNEFLLCLDANANHMNHLGTIHAGALYTLAEASSGEFLLRTFDEISHSVVSLVRKSEVRFRKTATGEIRSKAGFVDQVEQDVIMALETKNRTFIKVKVDLFDKDNSCVFSSVFEWFLTIR